MLNIHKGVLEGLDTLADAWGLPEEKPLTEEELAELEWVDYYTEGMDEDNE